MSEVGITADLLELKIKECQLGLFGWGDKPNHGKDIRATDSVSVEIKSALEKAAENGGVTCAALWSDRRSAPRKAKGGLCRLRHFKTQNSSVSARRLLSLRKNNGVRPPFLRGASGTLFFLHFWPSMILQPLIGANGSPRFIE